MNNYAGRGTGKGGGGVRHASTHADTYTLAGGASGSACGRDVCMGRRAVVCCSSKGLEHRLANTNRSVELRLETVGVSGVCAVARHAPFSLSLSPTPPPSLSPPTAPVALYFPHIGVTFDTFSRRVCQRRVVPRPHSYCWLTCLVVLRRPRHPAPRERLCLHARIDPTSPQNQEQGNKRMNG